MSGESEHEKYLKEKYGEHSTTLDTIQGVFEAIQSPVIWFREKIVEPRRNDYPWYHRQFRRVPTIDECYTDDYKCVYEADHQYQRDKWVDEQVVEVMRRRKDACYTYEGPDARETCAQLYEDFMQASDDYFTKYGDLGFGGDVKRAFMKQKHRLIWERRYGPIGTGKIPLEERKKMAEEELKRQKELAEEE